MALIVEKAAELYGTFDEMLPQLSYIFLGVEKSGPGTLVAAAIQAKKNGCAGIGRDPTDCHTSTKYFGDTGFHSDFRDGYNQLFHLWGYIADTAAPGHPFMGGVGFVESNIGNFGHEIVQSIFRYPKGGEGTSWQDFELSGQGMYIGELITTGSITPNELATVIRNNIGPNGPGSSGEFQMLTQLFGPLAGQR
jgi:hypothetical protein